MVVTQFLSVSAVLLSIGFEVAYGRKLLKKPPTTTKEIPTTEQMPVHLVAAAKSVEILTISAALLLMAAALLATLTALAAMPTTMQQSASVTPNPIQLSRPHLRSPEHSSSESQSPWLRRQGLAAVQQV